MVDSEDNDVLSFFNKLMAVESTSRSIVSHRHPLNIFFFTSVACQLSNYIGMIS